MTDDIVSLISGFTESDIVARLDSIVVATARLFPAFDPSFRDRAVKYMSYLLQFLFQLAVFLLILRQTALLTW